MGILFPGSQSGRSSGPEPSVQEKTQQMCESFLLTVSAAVAGMRGNTVINLLIRGQYINLCDRSPTTSPLHVQEPGSRNVCTVTKAELDLLKKIYHLPGEC